MPTTTNYGWTYPTDGGSLDAWGGICNTLFVDVDADLKALADLDAAKLPLAGGTLTGNVVVKTASGTVVAKGSISGAQSLDCSLGQFFTATHGGTVTYSFTNVPSNGFGFTLKMTGGSAGAVTWPASVKWPAGSAPTLSSGVDILGFLTFDGGTLWYGVYVNLAAA
jgi:hypothetical protein